MIFNFTKALEEGRAGSVPVGREAQAVDGISMVQGVQVLTIVQVPQHGLNKIQFFANLLIITYMVSLNQFIILEKFIFYLLIDYLLLQTIWIIFKSFIFTNQLVGIF